MRTSRAPRSVAVGFDAGAERLDFPLTFRLTVEKIIKNRPGGGGFDSSLLNKRGF
jgi:hypothetical protein